MRKKTRGKDDEGRLDDCPGEMKEAEVADKSLVLAGERRRSWTTTSDSEGVRGAEGCGRVGGGWKGGGGGARNRGL